MEEAQKPILLELFSGSKTVSTQFESAGWKSFSIDNNPKLKPQLCCDILQLSPGMLPGNVSFIWASPDCSKFSRAAAQYHWEKKTVKYRQYEFKPATPEAFISLGLLQKTVDIINSFYPVPFIIENPIGRIHHFSPLKNLGHYRYAVNYADFGFPYSKETYLFSNLFLPFSTKKVKSTLPGLRTINSRYQRSKVPALLIDFIINYLDLNYNSKSFLP